MTDGGIDLARARILISNDDGIHAPGLKLLERIARGLSDDVWVVAPEREQSGASHSLTFTAPLRIRRLSRQRFAVDGTPTDCVLLAIKHIMTDRAPDLVLSGINAGGNLGEDVTYSGTVAAAMEATLLGVPAIALSQDRCGVAKLRWRTAESHAAAVIRRLAGAPWLPNVLINVNFPDVPPEGVTGFEVASQGRRKPGDDVTVGRDPRGNEYVWIGTRRANGPPGRNTDLLAVSRGAIAITPLSLDLTHRAGLKALREALA